MNKKEKTNEDREKNSSPGNPSGSSRCGFEKTVKNADSSIDIYFGPKQPKGVADTNFIKTVPGRYFLAALRLFGTSIEFFDQTWKPDDLVKLK